MTIKYDSSTYNLGTNYYNYPQAFREQIDVALNSIDPKSKVGKVLNGQDEQHIIFLAVAESHVGTDNQGLEHINIQLKVKGGEQKAQMHLYPDGSYTTDKWSGKILGVPQQTSTSKAKIPDLNDQDDFPTLG